LYGKLGWGFIGRNDLCFKVRIGDDNVRAIRSKKKEEVRKTNDLKQIFPF
jgi:hypothetical protein